MVFVAATTGTDETGHPRSADDMYGQAHDALAKIERALQEAGASMKDVVRSTIYVTDISRWEEVGRAHAEFFGDVRPAATMVEVCRLIGPDLLVEIAVDAVIGSGQ
jgi:enamine deaminase RidA (YjgF/YER057c/UK114 family)